MNDILTILWELNFEDQRRSVKASPVTDFTMTTMCQQRLEKKEKLNITISKC